MERWINKRPSRAVSGMLGLIPLIILLLLYMAGSEARLAENPADKLLPSFEQFSQAIERMAFEPSKRTGEYLFWVDTQSSLIRLGLGVGIASLLGLVVGVLTGALPVVRALFNPLLTVVSLIPPLAILPILFIVLGLGELSKVVLITIGVMPFIARDIQRRTQEIPSEQIIKAQTLGANTSQILLRIILPQIMPRLIDATRLSLGAAWLFLIAAEAIASTDGLGYRIFLVRRYLAMDVILPYVAWITLLAFLSDWVLAKISYLCFPWDRLDGAER